jgi:hypothetical protein
LAELDLSVLKNARVSERVNLQFRRGVFQYSEPCELRHAEPGGVFLSHYHAVSDGRSDFVHGFDIQADSVRVEAAVLVLYP